MELRDANNAQVYNLSQDGKATTTGDIIIDLATKGLVLKDTQNPAHYWRVRVSSLGVLTTTDLGTTRP